MSLLDDPAYVADLNSDMSNVAIGAKWGPNEASVRRHKKALAEDAIEGDATLTGRAEFTSEGGSFTDVQTAAPLTNWDDIFKRFNRDPNEFVIADDTVRMSNWQQSKRLDNGERDIINLYSYSARFTRKTEASIDVAGMVKSLRKWKSNGRAAVTKSKPLTMFVGWADWQLGKNEGPNRGTKETTQRILDSFEATEKRIRELRKIGRNIEGIVFGNMGDHTEAVTGHYTSQTYSVDLNQRDQLNLAIELNLTGIKALAPLASYVTYMACLCNHGQWQRVAGKALTDDSDNSTGFIGDTLKTVCNLHDSLSHVDWIIPRDEMITTGTFSGVNVAAAHGHKISGSEENWLSKQSAWLQTSRDFRPGLWVTAHRHTAVNEDFGNYHRVQCATNDPGSKSFTDGTGKFSTPGTTTFLIGEHLTRKHSDYAVL